MGCSSIVVQFDVITELLLGGVVHIEGRCSFRIKENFSLLTIVPIPEWDRPKNEKTFKLEQIKRGLSV